MCLARHSRETGQPDGPDGLISSHSCVQFDGDCARGTLDYLGSDRPIFGIAHTHEILMRTERDLNAPRAQPAIVFQWVSPPPRTHMLCFINSIGVCSIGCCLYKSKHFLMAIKTKLSIEDWMVDKLGRPNRRVSGIRRPCHICLHADDCKVFPVTVF